MEMMMLANRNGLSVKMGLFLTVAVLVGCGDAADDRAAPAAPGTQPAAPPAAVSGTPGATPAGGAAGQVEEGRQVFAGAGICFTCHGQNAQGTPLGPNLADGQWLWVEEGPNFQAELANVIRAGVPQPREYPAPMPPRGGANLSDQQIDAVAAYLISLN
jgi:mono/diheme cytochrome c family protein